MAVVVQIVPANALSDTLRQAIAVVHRKFIAIIDRSQAAV